MVAVIVFLAISVRAWALFACISQTPMPANNISDVWPLAGFKASTMVNQHFSPIISFTLGQELTSTLLGIV